MCALRHAERGELLGVLGVADIDNGCSVRAAHMRHVRDVVLDHDLSAAGAIEITDLANADTGPHDELPRLMMVKLPVSIPECRPRFLEPAADTDGSNAPRETGLVVGLDRKAAQRRGPER